LRKLPVLAAAAALLAFGLTGGGGLAPGAAASPRPEGRSQEGKASYYGRQFHGRRMASGKRFDLNSNAAAHRTLPLGSTARVTNLENGRSATVQIEDRGPRARNRVIDVSPRTAERLGMRKDGTAPVRVTPLDVPGRAERGGRVREARR
jgi:rare lipoprotein A